MAEKHQCQKRIYSEGYSMTGGFLCSINATFQRDGKWYCGIHDPIRITERNKAKEAKWKEQWTERRRRYALDSAQQKATKGLTLEEVSRITPELIREVLSLQVKRLGEKEVR